MEQLLESKVEKKYSFPKLRFQEYKELWESKELRNIGQFIGGGTPSTYINEFWKGDNPWISSSDINGDSFKVISSRYISKEAIDKSSTKLVPPNSILIVSRVGVGKIAINESFIFTSQDFINLNPYSDNHIFLAYLLKNKINDLLGYNQGTSIKGFVKDDLLKLKIDLPTKYEQTKIASFLTTVDEKIQALKKKKRLLEEYKKGVMQKLFSQELRFKDEDGEDFPKWQTKPLTEIAKRITSRNTSDNKNVLTISAQHGLISQRDFFSKSIHGKDLRNYYLINKGDFAYNKSYSTGFPMGAIKCLKFYKQGVVSTLYICFRFHGEINIQFVEHYFESGIQNQEISKMAQEGARNHGLLNITLDDFFSININVPVIEEQNKIANYLNTLDEKLLSIKNQIDKAETWKKGLLQRMFC